MRLPVILDQSEVAHLIDGVRTYTYTALATTPGEYVLPPLKAEEMYSPEVYGRTASGKLIVD